MLKAMRKHAKYFYVLFFIVIITFIFWGVGVDRSTSVPVATVDKHKITLEEYWRAYDNALDVYREIYKDKFDDKLMEKLNLREKVLESLIDEKVLVIAADRIGISVSDREVEDAIKSNPAFHKEGQFSGDLYIRVLQRNRLNEAQYEAMKRRELVMGRIKDLVEDSVVLAPNELKGLQGDEKFVKAVEDAFLKNKKEMAFKSYVEGLKGQMKDRIQRNTKLIT